MWYEREAATAAIFTIHLFGFCLVDQGRVPGGDLWDAAAASSTPPPDINGRGRPCFSSAPPEALDSAICMVDEIRKTKYASPP